MKYKYFELLYQDELDFIKRQKKYENEDHINGMYRMLRSMSRSLKLELEDFPIIKDNKFKYRNQIFDVLVDDYGQQLYIDYKGHTISGGSFNPSPEIDFSEQLDEILDEEYLNS